MGESAIEDVILIDDDINLPQSNAPIKSQRQSQQQETAPRTEIVDLTSDLEIAPSETLPKQKSTSADLEIVSSIVIERQPAPKKHKTTNFEPKFDQTGTKTHAPWLPPPPSRQLYQTKEKTTTHAPFHTHLLPAPPRHAPQQQQRVVAPLPPQKQQQKHVVPPQGNTLKKDVQKKSNTANTAKKGVEQTPKPQQQSSGITATAKLQKEVKKWMKEPLPLLRALPSPTNILEWHYVLEGDPDGEYSGGYYHGKMVFPADYPWKPPSIMLLTPNGRFQPNQRICLSISDYHPESWNPMWDSQKILLGLQSFFYENIVTAGSVTPQPSKEKKKELAKGSLAYNVKNTMFVNLFPELVVLHAEQQKAGKNIKKTTNTTSNTTSNTTKKKQ